jgi:hypothetical protein
MNEPIKRGRGRPKKAIPPDDGSKPDLPEHMWTTLEIELSYGDDIGRASLGLMKRRLEENGIKRGREIICRWRQDPLYQRGFNWLLSQMMDEWLRWDDKADERERAPAKEVEARIRARLPLWLTTGNRWHGAIRSAFNGVIYTTPETYAQHLLDIKRYPAELEDEVRAELAAEAERIRLSA